MTATTTTAKTTDVRNEADILAAYRGTPIGELLRYQNLGATPRQHEKPELLIASCLEQRAPLRVPDGFAISLRTAAANLKRDPFKVSWAIGVAGVRAVAIVGHDDCTLTTLRGQREDFVVRMIEAAGWERPAAEQHFDHWSDLFEVESPLAFVAAEAARLQSRYPKMLVAPLLYQAGTGTLLQVVA
jgi:carbonic anhydrase